MKVTSVTTLNEKFLECDLTTQTENFYIKSADSFVLVHNSPALIFGWQGDTFVLTDKAGFGAKGYNGLTTSSGAIESMIMNRKMRDTSEEAVARRQVYASTIAGLYPILRDTVPRTFQGFAQGDLLWTSTPPVIAGAYEFRPVKVRYRIPVSSELGQEIEGSQMGIVIHSVYSSPQDEEPEALRDVRSLGFKSGGALVIVPHEIKLTQTLELEPAKRQELVNVLQERGSEISSFFDSAGLSENEIMALPGVMKSFLAWKAGEGSHNYNNIASEFLEWIVGPASKASPKMRPRIIAWIQDHLAGFNATWHVVQLTVDLKLNLKAQMDAQARGTVGAQLRDIPGHEGFVSVTPYGIIKFVNRPEFMKKEKPVEQLTEAAGNHVAWCFGRANPPTRGHQKLIEKLAQSAGPGGDYYIFLSQSQDNKKNPLDWETKVGFVKRIMPKYASHIVEDTSLKTPLLAADWLYNQGYRSMTFVCGSDRVESMSAMLEGWNSPTIREKYHRDPVELQVVSAGERDPDAEGVEGISGTKAREDVQNGDQEAFEAHTGLSGDIAQELFDAVKSGMAPRKKVKESRSFLQQSSFEETALPLTSTPALDDADLTGHPHGTVVMVKMHPESAQRLREWCQAYRVPAIDPEHMHCTVLYSRDSVPHLVSMHTNQVRMPAEIQGWKKLGDSALTLLLDCPLSHQFHNQLRKQGGSHDFPEYLSHASVNYDWHTDDVPSACPDFPLEFNRIVVLPIDPDFVLPTSG